MRRALGMLRDRVLGIDTAEHARLEDLGLGDPDRVDYEPSGWFDLRRILRGVEVGSADVFVDLGCGKGRVILLAGRYRFGRIIGVELSEDLSAVARRNVAARRVHLRCADVDVVTADVADYRIPDDVSVVYIYNAVRGPIFDAVVANLIASVDRCPRTVRLIYQNAREHERLVSTGRFRLVRTVGRRRPFRDQGDRTYLRLYLLEPAIPGRSPRLHDVGGLPIEGRA